MLTALQVPENDPALTTASTPPRTAGSSSASTYVILSGRTTTSVFVTTSYPTKVNRSTYVPTGRLSMLKRPSAPAAAPRSSDWMKTVAPGSASLVPASLTAPAIEPRGCAASGMAVKMAAAAINATDPWCLDIC
jgi:hypothetical protein